MNKVLLALAFTLALGPPASAHEGHAKKTMGRVTVINGDHLAITTAPGKSSMFRLNDKTKVLKGKAAHKVSDIKVGDRVVITASDVKDKDGKVMWMAKQITLGTDAVAASKK